MPDRDLAVCTINRIAATRADAERIAEDVTGFKRPAATRRNGDSSKLVVTCAPGHYDESGLLLEEARYRLCIEVGDLFHDEKWVHVFKYPPGVGKTMAICEELRSGRYSVIANDLYRAPNRVLLLEPTREMLKEAERHFVNLPRFDLTRFGVLPAVNLMQPKQPTINVFDSLRECASKRLAHLLVTKSYSQIADTLDAANRYFATHTTTSCSDLDTDYRAG